MESFIITSSCDSLQLSGFLARPTGTCRGVVQLVHGMCDHKERYVPFMEFLAVHGYAAVIIDQRGHGESVQSPDDLGYMYDAGWNGLVEDQKDLYTWAKQQYPDVPYTMLGHSMGSMVVRSYIKRYDDTIDKLFVIGCPSDNPAKGFGKTLSWLIGTIQGWHSRPLLMLWLSFGQYNKPFANEGYRNAWVCSDKAVLDAYHNDPLCKIVFTSNGFYNLLALMQDVYSAKGWTLKNKHLPIHFLSGAEDPCRVSDKAFTQAVDFLKRVGYSHVDGTLYPAMRHEILNETNKQQVWNDILAQL